MAYYSGTASTAADLASALKSACVAQGWTLTGNVLSKGTSYFEISSSANAVAVCGGTSQSGGVLAGYPSLSTIYPSWDKWYAKLIGVGAAIQWPVQYYIHILSAPEEVYLIANYSLDKYSHLAFGRFSSPATGTGNWFCGTGGRYESWAYVNASTGVEGGQQGNDGLASIAPFSLSSSSGTTGNTQNTFNSFVHHALDGNSWSLAGFNGAGTSVTDVLTGSVAFANAWKSQQQHLSRSPNIWNSEAVLLPIQPCIMRNSLKISQLGELAYARYLRIDNYDPQQVITLGADKWRIYPFARKNISARDGGSDKDHSGTFGWAIRYDGP